MIEFKLPELGENIDQGDLVRLMVAPGASVSAGQSVMELETDKAVVEVPSSVSGTVQEIRVKEGDKIKVGQVIFTVDGAGSKASAEPAAQAARQRAAPAPQDRAAPCRAGCSAQVAAPKPPQSAAAASRLSHLVGASEFKLPELGENISQGDLVRLMIAPGTKVSEGQPVMELETDKAVVEVPSSVSGVVKEVKVKEGEKVKVGQVIFTLEGGAPPQARSGPSAQRPVEHVSGQHGARLAFQAAIRAEGKTEEQALPPDQPQRAPPAFSHASATWQSCRDRASPACSRRAACAAARARNRRRHLRSQRYRARRPHQRRRRQGLCEGAALRSRGASRLRRAPDTSPQPQLPDFAKWGKIERVSMRGVRRKTAEHLAKPGTRFRMSRSTIAPTSPNSSNCAHALLPRPKKLAAR